MYAKICAEIADGGRAFIVCPMIEESEVPSHKLLKAAISERERLHSSGGPLPDLGPVPISTLFKPHLDRILTLRCSESNMQSLLLACIRTSARMHMLMLKAQVCRMVVTDEH